MKTRLIDVCCLLDCLLDLYTDCQSSVALQPQAAGHHFMDTSREMTFFHDMLAFEVV